MAEQFTETITFLDTKEENHRTWVLQRASDHGAPYLGYVDRTLAQKEGEKIELRRRVEPNMYGEYIKVRDAARQDVVKRVIQFVYEGRRFNIESYQDRAGQQVTVARVFVEAEAADIKFPDFLKVGAEVTEEPKYFTHNLADPNFADRKSVV